MLAPNIAYTGTSREPIESAGESLQEMMRIVMESPIVLRTPWLNVLLPLSGSTPTTSIDLLTFHGICTR